MWRDAKKDVGVGCMGRPMHGASTVSLMAKGPICASSLTPESYLVIGVLEDPRTGT